MPARLSEADNSQDSAREAGKQNTGGLSRMSSRLLMQYAEGCLRGDVLCCCRYDGDRQAHARNGRRQSPGRQVSRSRCHLHSRKAVLPCECCMSVSSSMYQTAGARGARRVGTTFWVTARRHVAAWLVLPQGGMPKSSPHLLYQTASLPKSVIGETDVAHSMKDGLPVCMLQRPLAGLARVLVCMHWSV